MALKNLNPCFIISPVDFDLVKIVNQLYIRERQMKFNLHIEQPQC